MIPKITIIKTKIFLLIMIKIILILIINSCISLVISLTIQTMSYSRSKIIKIIKNLEK
jgi:hypothetical protein